MHDAGRTPVTAVSRRRTLGAGLAALGSLLLGRDARARRRRGLDLYAVNTGERLSVDYVDGGRYQRATLRAVDRFLRDHHSGDVHPIDPGVLDLVYGLGRLLGTRQAAHIVCGYRSPATNARKLAAGRGVSKHSLHLQGRALDLFFPDRSLIDLRRAALRLGAGGVGYYPRAGFVHVDTGPVRAW